MDDDPKNWTAAEKIIEAVITAVGFGVLIWASRSWGPDVGAWIFGLFS